MGPFFESVQVRDVGMVQRCEHLRFALESRDAIRITDERGGEDLNRDVAIEFRIARAVDLAHAAGADGGDDFISAKARTGTQRHWRALAWAPTRCLASARRLARLGGPQAPIPPAPTLDRTS